MDELLEQFLIEGRDLIAQAHAAVLVLSRDGSDEQALGELFRAVHTLKGSVALFDMAPAERILHEAESRLDGVRRGSVRLDSVLLESLVAVLDQTDRWIDAMGDAGRLDDDAPRTAAAILDLLASRTTATIATAALEQEQVPPSGDLDWVSALGSRPELADHTAQGSGVVFRYTPDSECFFRGEDPLSVVAAVPGLVAIAVLPSQGQWPVLAECEPFHCFGAIEGVSTAADDLVRTAFRMVPDQVAFASFANNERVYEADIGRGVPETSTLLRVEAAVLDQLASQSGELAVAARALEPLVARAEMVDPALAHDLHEAWEEISKVSAALQRSVSRTRLVSLEPSLRRLPRLARETAATLGKQVRFTLSGETTQVDKRIADQIFEPLLHIIRNAIDHGIERREIRLQNGKSATGEVSLSISQDGDVVDIAIADDGGGMDASLIREAAVRKGLLPPEAASRLGEAEAFQLIFLPGFSTTDAVTDVSGRGVGMDVVKTGIERLGGAIAIASTPGTGTRFNLRLPVNAISTPVLVVEAGGEYLGVRFDQIVETTRIPASDIQAVGLGKACVLRDAAIPVIDLAQVLGLGSITGDDVRLLVTEVSGNRAAIRINAFAERFDAVIHKPSGLLGAFSRISGTAQRADGSLVLVLDLQELIA